jgi:NADH:ubiquinone oxidoreductase subunit 5 (subunit L)/multisubunit Na+/H+ antiporter MnhA subunit
MESFNTILVLNNAISRAASYRSFNHPNCLVINQIVTRIFERVGTSNIQRINLYSLYLMILTFFYISFISILVPLVFRRHLGLYGIATIIGIGRLMDCVISILLLSTIATGTVTCETILGGWIKTSFITVEWAFIVDTLTVVAFFVISIVSMSVHLYAIVYMQDDPNAIRFILLLASFSLCMYFLVASNNLVQFMLGWEGVGIVSYLLINFWYQRVAANRSALQAIIFNRIGDCALLIVIAILFNKYMTGEFLVLNTLCVDASEDLSVTLQEEYYAKYLSSNIDFTREAMNRLGCLFALKTPEDAYLFRDVSFGEKYQYSWFAINHNIKGEGRLTSKMYCFSTKESIDTFYEIFKTDSINKFKLTIEKYLQVFLSITKQEFSNTVLDMFILAGMDSPEERIQKNGLVIDLHTKSLMRNDLVRLRKELLSDYKELIDLFMNDNPTSAMKVRKKKLFDKLTDLLLTKHYQDTFTTIFNTKWFAIQHDLDTGKLFLDSSREVDTARRFYSPDIIDEFGRIIITNRTRMYGSPEPIILETLKKNSLRPIMHPYFFMGVHKGFNNINLKNLLEISNSAQYIVAATHGYNRNLLVNELLVNSTNRFNRYQQIILACNLSPEECCWLEKILFVLYDRHHTHSSFVGPVTTTIKPLYGNCCSVLDSSLEKYLSNALKYYEPVLGSESSTKDPFVWIVKKDKDLNYLSAKLDSTLQLSVRASKIFFPIDKAFIRKVIIFEGVSDTAINSFLATAFHELPCYSNEFLGKYILEIFSDYRHANIFEQVSLRKTIFLLDLYSQYEIGTSFLLKFPRISLSVVKQVSTLEKDKGFLLLVTTLLLIGAIAKSAQVGLHLWLPSAMEGPTPVSALLHSSTMVVAGVFLILRTSFIFQACPTILTIICLVASATITIASVMGCMQYDLKKIIAFSTCSQLGYMFLASGLSNYTGSCFHLLTHAFFKALLFLCAGYIIHTVDGEQDMRRLGGLKQRMPIVYATTLIGFLALNGIPYMSGYYSKEFILLSGLLTDNRIGFGATILSILALSLTSLYSTRFIYYTFIAQPASRLVVKATEDSILMLFSLLLLSILTITSGFWFSDIMIGPGTVFWNDSLSNSEVYSYKVEFLPSNVHSIPLVVTILGVLLFFYYDRLNRTFDYSLKYSRFLHDTGWDSLYKHTISMLVLVLSHNKVFEMIDRGLLEYFGSIGIVRLFDRTVAYNKEVIKKQDFVFNLITVIVGLLVLVLFLVLFIAYAEDAIVLTLLVGLILIMLHYNDL